ncbi:hypothetical protein AX769_21920 (plasmid) [Frondihabitans sp. PAMC 28766]|nr:hypothetical protein AX769_21920 [Frondihabitans sp. PAMC 28766]
MTLPAESHSPDAAALQDALAAELRAVQAVANVKVRAWAENIPVSPDSVYRVLRGQRPVSVIELILLCDAIKEDPLDLITRAVNRAALSGATRQ